MSNDRNEKPTPKRREDARRKGQIARRPELPAAASFLSALALLQAVGGELLARSGRLLTASATQINDPAPLTLAAARGVRMLFATRLDPAIQQVGDACQRHTECQHPGHHQK